MSSPNLNLPILDGYLLGDQISSHDGVSCYPAVKRGSNEQYILKVVSIPASRDKLDALLLTGALSDQKAALAYFETLATDILAQSETLRELSHQEGFAAYLDAHMTAMRWGIGYEVYLLGTYKKSLAQILETEAMTHSEVINIGLDLCAALAACRRAGWLYVDLKPGNVFWDDAHGFRIGDVGFIAISSLKYASMPDKFRSSYTAPELSDDFAVLNTTVDLYALGLILHQAYNGGKLPFEGVAPDGALPDPLYADYEMARIIAKACHPDPAQRWQDPTQFAQALIGYLQEFGAPETPIIPPMPEMAEPEEDVEEFLPEADPEQLQQEILALDDAEAEELAFFAELSQDETAPSEENAADVADDVITEETSQMLAHVDDLVAHTIPLPPVTPEMPTEEAERGVEEEETVPTEALVQTEDPQEAETSEENETTQEDATQEAPVPLADTAEEPKNTQENDCKKPFHFPWRIGIIALAVLLLLGACFFAKHYYDNIYTLHIQSMLLESNKDTLTVQLQTGCDESLLQVICADSYGNSYVSRVTGGMAQFTQLKADTRYTVRVIAAGRHRVTGHMTETFTTVAETKILTFTASIGPEDRSVNLHFTLSGPEPKQWCVRYFAEGFAEQTVYFTGNNVEIHNLAVGAEYTFLLATEEDLFLSGQTQVKFLATNILYAQELTITACGNGSLTAQWQQPADGNVAQWRVRCYNEDGYDTTVITDQLYYTFTALDHNSPCTVEVTAVGMHESISATISANPITITNFQCSITEEMSLVISWEYSGHTPEGGWLLEYNTLDGISGQISTEATSVPLMLLPNSSYQLLLRAADDSFVFGCTHSYSVSDVQNFSGFGITGTDLQSSLFLWPEEDLWDWEDIPQENNRNNFTYGETAGLSIFCAATIEASEDPVNVQFVIHNAEGMALRMDSATMIWNGMWQDNHCVLALPYLPQVPGAYSLSLFFDGQFVCRQEFVIV